MPGIIEFSKLLSFNKFTLFIIIRGPQRGTGANEGVGRSGTSRKGKRNEITPFLMLGIKSEICREGNK